MFISLLFFYSGIDNIGDGYDLTIYPHSKVSTALDLSRNLKPVNSCYELATDTIEGYFTLYAVSTFSQEKSVHDHKNIKHFQSVAKSTARFSSSMSHGKEKLLASFDHDLTAVYDTFDCLTGWLSSLHHCNRMCLR